MWSGPNIYELRRWMYTFKDDEGIITKDFSDGVKIFMHQATNTTETMESGKMLCPCRKCKNTRYVSVDNVWTHLFNRGFTPNYYIWYQHGEGSSGNDIASSSNHGIEHAISHHDHTNIVDHNLDGNRHHHDRFNEMVTDAFPENMGEEPNVDARRFYEMLDNANQPIYDGCRDGLSRLSLASRMMNIKTDHNLSENCMDSWAELFKEYLPEENVAADSYYDIQKLVSSLGLPSEMIDVCVDNCMIFLGNDNTLEECKLCQKPRFKPQATGRARVPYQRMWYLPITDRLKRLYQSEKTTSSMRWHAEHIQKAGEIAHPFDAKAWKHFQTVHIDFAEEHRNVYLNYAQMGLVHLEYRVGSIRYDM